MKKLLSVIVTFSLIVMGACARGNDGNHTIEKNEVVVSTIKYRYVDSTAGEVKEIPDFMWKGQGLYPNEFEEGSEKKIDSLRCYRKNSDTIYAFEGWYYDAEYKNKLVSNKINATIRGDILLWAKIVERAKTNVDVVTASITYVWEDFGLGEEGINKTTEGINLPTEYVEGEQVVLPKLKTWKQSSKVSYRFVGWYYDSNFQNKLVGEAIPETQTGNLIIYPLIEIWVG